MTTPKDEAEKLAREIAREHLSELASSQDGGELRDLTARIAKHIEPLFACVEALQALNLAASNDGIECNNPASNWALSEALEETHKALSTLKAKERNETR